MTTFKWRNPQAESPNAPVEIEAYRIEFAPGHVVFYNEDNRILRAEQNRYVDDLEQLVEICGVSHKGGPPCTFRHVDGKHSWETPCGRKIVYPPPRVPEYCAKMTHPDTEPHDWEESDAEFHRKLGAWPGEHDF